MLNVVTPTPVRAPEANHTLRAPTLSQISRGQCVEFLTLAGISGMLCVSQR